MSFWYNVDTGLVETDETRSRGAEILGPYPTEEAAQRALQTAREKTERWDEEDRDWKQRNVASGWDDEED